MEVAFDGPAAGLNVPIVVGALLASAVAFRQPGRSFDRLDAWLPVTALVLAAFVPIRGDDFLATLDTLGAAAFSGATLIALAGVPVTRRSAGAIVALGMWLLAWAATGIRRVLPVAYTSRPESRQRRLTWIAPVARGLAIALPLATIFAVLFASADPIFRRGLEDLVGLRIDLGSLPGRAMFTLSATWLAIGLLAAVIMGAPNGSVPDKIAGTDGAADAIRSPGAAAAPASPVLASFGTLEATVVLVIVDVVVGAFVGLQMAYLFGGLDTLVAAGISYSADARRGFFELVAAAVLAGLIVAALEGVVRVRSRGHLVAALGLLGLTGAVLTSAAYRLALYQAAYGWTELRFYVFTAIGYVAIALALLAVLLVLRQTRWLAHGLGLLAVVGLVVLNLSAPASFVAERNLERVLEPGLVPPDGQSGLDARYLAELPDDAVLPMMAVLDWLPDRERMDVRAILVSRRESLASDPSLRGPMAWNLTRERARDALSRLP